MNAKRFLDSNVLVYANDSSNTVKQARAQTLIAEVGLAGDGVISVQVMGEFFHVTVVKLKVLTAPEAEKLLNAYTAAMTVLPVEVPLVERAVRIHQRYQTRYWDSLIIAAAADHGCREILSEDLSDGQTYDGVRVVNPFKAAVP